MGERQLRVLLFQIPLLSIPLILNKSPYSSLPLPIYGPFPPQTATDSTQPPFAGQY